MFAYSDPKFILFPNFEETVFASTNQELPLPSQSPNRIKMRSKMSPGNPQTRTGIDIIR